MKIAQAWKILEGKAEAMRIERHIKKLSHIDKSKLIKEPTLLDIF